MINYSNSISHWGVCMIKFDIGYKPIFTFLIKSKRYPEALFKKPELIILCMRERAGKIWRVFKKVIYYTTTLPRLRIWLRKKPSSRTSFCRMVTFKNVSLRRGPFIDDIKVRYLPQKIAVAPRSGSCTIKDGS